MWHLERGRPPNPGRGFPRGAYVGKNEAFLAVDRWTCQAIAAPFNGGAIAVASTVNRGGIDLTNNSANGDGGVGGGAII